MPRRRPGALRAPRHGPRVQEDPPQDPPPGRIHGLSGRTSLAVHRAERLSDDYYVFPGATEVALRRCREFLRTPGRKPLYPQDTFCTCRGCSLADVRHARDVLEEVLRMLPHRPRAELRRQVARFDARFRERTLPDPFAGRRPWEPDVWWYHRLTEGGQSL
ncbi:hypothetical protein [Streptomyces sp. NPDC002644]